MDALNHLGWTITDGDLSDIDGGLRYGTTPITQEQINRLYNEKIPLKTPNLTLKFFRTRYATDDDEETYDFPTGPSVTPVQVLSAIYNYYNTPLTVADLEELDPETTPVYDDVLDRVRRGEKVPRSELMVGLIFFEGLQEDPDGSYFVKLGS